MTGRLFKYFVTMLLATQLYPVNLIAQGLNVSVTAGAGTYRMQNLKTFIEIVNESLPFSPVVVDEFPPYFWYAATASVIKGDFNWGITVNYNSTGSRVSLKDYSGEYLSDRKLCSVSPGITAGYLLPPLGNHFSFSPVAGIGVIVTGMEVDETLIAAGDTVSDFHQNYRAINFFAHPSVRFGWTISSMVGLELQAGYLLQIGNGQFKSISHRDSGVGIYHVNPEWTGLRCGISIVISLPSKTGVNSGSL
jgi:hypothetical protein